MKEGEQLPAFALSLSYGTATVRGVVKLENGSLPPEGADHYREINQAR